MRKRCLSSRNGDDHPALSRADGDPPASNDAPLPAFYRALPGHHGPAAPRGGRPRWTPARLSAMIAVTSVGCRRSASHSLRKPRHGEIATSRARRRKRKRPRSLGRDRAPAGRRSRATDPGRGRAGERGGSHRPRGRAQGRRAFRIAGAAPRPARDADGAARSVPDLEGAAADDRRHLRAARARRRTHPLAHALLPLSPSGEPGGPRRGRRAPASAPSCSSCRPAR